MKQRLKAALKNNNVDLAILVSMQNVIYASEFEVPYWGGFMQDMAEGLPMVTAILDVRDNTIELVASDFYQSRIQRAGIENGTYYTSFSYQESYVPEEAYKSVLVKVLGKKRGIKNIGIEIQNAPKILLEVLDQAFPKGQIKDVSAAMREARKIKTPQEISRIEKAARAADAAQNCLIELSRIPGDYTELELWFEVQKSVCRETGCLSPFYGELVTGPNTGLSDYPLGPTGRRVEKGDLAIMDVGPRVEGYWSDCSNVVVFFEEPNQEQKKYFRAVKAAYEAGRDIIRPGISFQKVNQVMAAAYEKHGFSLCSYLGHQIGVSVNEGPRFTIFENAVLEEDMVVCIEPQLYTGSAGKTGIRLEKMLHVTKDGARELNQFPWGIED